MRKTLQVLALATVAALGLVTSAYAASGPHRWRPPALTTVTTATTTAATTTAATTTTAAATTAPSPSGPTMTITAPLNYTATLRNVTEIVAASISDSTPVVSCDVDFGDGTTQAVTPTPQADGTYACAVSHRWAVSGTYIVRVSAVDAIGSTTSKSIYLYMV